MESSEIMTQSSVLPFDASHIGLTDNLVTIGYKHGINMPAICDVEEASSETNHCPEWFECLCASVTNSPSENTWLEVVYGSPEPDLVFLAPTKV